MDLKTLKFSAIGAENLYEDALVNIEGQILKGVAKTAGGAPRDSIWMKVTHEGDTFVEEGLPGVPNNVPPGGKKADFPAGGSEIAPPDMEKTGRRRQCQPAIC